MYKTVFLFILTVVSVVATAQTVKVKPSGTKGDLPFKVRQTGSKVIAEYFEPQESSESKVDISKFNLTDIYGNKVKPVLDRVTIIEYWTEKSNPENRYWNRMREMEHRYKDSGEIQFISINYDTVKPPIIHREAMAAFVKNNTPPQTLYLDKDNGVRSLMVIPGPVSYLLIDHRGQYIYGGRGDDPDTESLFTERLDNCLGYQAMNKNPAGSVAPRN